MDFAALIYHRQAFLDGYWWLPLTAQLAHFNLGHGMSNAMVALVLAALFRPMLVWAQQGALIFGSAFAVAVAVVSDANCGYYAGASGALYGWAAGGCLITIFSRNDSSQPHRRIAFLCCACWWSAWRRCSGPGLALQRGAFRFIYLLIGQGLLADLQWLVYSCAERRRLRRPRIASKATSASSHPDIVPPPPPLRYYLRWQGSRG